MERLKKTNQTMLLVVGFLTAIIPAFTFTEKLYNGKAVTVPELLEQEDLPVSSAKCRSSFLRRGVAQFGRALGSGPRGHGFKSRHSDQNRQASQGCLPIFHVSLSLPEAGGQTGRAGKRLPPVRNGSAAAVLPILGLVF